MNAIPANELKRHGISAIEKLLANGPVHVIKRNQPVCVVLAEEEYRQLTRAAQAGGRGGNLTVREWMTTNIGGSLAKEEIDRCVTGEREAWGKT